MTHTRQATPLLALLLLLYAASATAGSVFISGAGGFYSLKVTSFKEARFRTVIKQKYDYSCGSAALATLLTYHHQDPTEEEVALEAMFKGGDQEKIRREGFSLLDMKRYLEANGYLADGYRLSLDLLAKTGYPAIALIDADGYKHFVVIKGVRRNEVLVGDPYNGIMVIPRKKFRTMWPNGIVLLARNANAAKGNHVFNDVTEWRVRAKAPLRAAVTGQSLASFSLLLPPSSDF